MVACGFETKKIASANEVRNKTADPVPRGAHPGPPQPTEAAQAAARAQAAQAATGDVPTEAGDPRNIVIHFGKNKGKRLGDLSEKSLGWYANTWEPDPQYGHTQGGVLDRALKLGAQMILGLAPDEIPPASDDDIPF